MKKSESLSTGKKKGIIFDLDGTLIDSVEDIALCMNEVLQNNKLKTYEINQYKYFVGGGVDILVENILKDQNINLSIKTNLAKQFKDIYETNVHHNTKPYEDIEKLLEELERREFKIGVLSNKPDKFTKAYVAKFFSKYNIQEIHGQKENIPKKPDPTAAINIADNFDILCEEVYFVGDTMIDMQTANNANMLSIGVLWGFRDEEELKEHKAQYIIKTPLEILDIIS